LFRYGGLIAHSFEVQTNDIGVVFLVTNFSFDRIIMTRSGPN
jgi:hypothetical protein